MVNKAELRQFIVQYFSDIELDELCFDYFPDLLNEFTAGMTKSQKTIALIGYCERRGRLDHLLTALAQLRPQAFARQFGLVPTLEKSDPDEQRNPNQVFLSHANQDAAFALQLAGDLRRTGIDVWIALDSIRPGEKWVDAINRGLETSGDFVLVMTARAAASKWVRDESSYAIALENRGVMRFLTLDVDGGQVPPLWSVRQHISFREDYEEGFRQLLAVLRPDRATKSAAAASIRRAPAQSVEETREIKPTPEPVAAKEPGPSVEKPLVTNVAEPLELSAGGAATQQSSAAIGQPEPTPLEQSTVTTLPGKPLYWALGAVAVLGLIIIGWQLMGAGNGGSGTSVAGVPPAADSANSGGAGSDPTRTSTPSQTVDSNGSGAPVAATSELGEVRAVMRGSVEVEQVFVPAGSFMMGSKAGDSDETPVHEVTLDAFWLDRTEVTNAQWAACVADGACQPSPRSDSNSRDSYYDNAQYANYPVIYVSRSDARDFCSWAGGRLPTEAEWEYAARGPEAPTYPWGDDELSSTLLNFNRNVNDTTETGSYPAGASWIGALDMAGNVWEWVNDRYDSEYYGRSPGENPGGPSSGEFRVLRGGAWNSNDFNVRSANRYASLQPDAVLNFVGFRCAQ